MHERDSEMSDIERRMAEHVASTVVSRLIDAVQDKETASRVMEIWGGEIDRTIGRGLRRAMWYLLLGLAAIAATKFGLWDKVIGWLK